MTRLHSTLGFSTIKETMALYDQTAPPLLLNNTTSRGASDHTPCFPCPFQLLEFIHLNIPTAYCKLQHTNPPPASWFTSFEAFGDVGKKQAEKVDLAPTLL